MHHPWQWIKYSIDNLKCSQHCGRGIQAYENAPNSLFYEGPIL